MDSLENNTSANKGRFWPAWWVWLIVPLAVFVLSYDRLFVSSSDREAYDAFLGNAEVWLSEDAHLCSGDANFDACLAALRPARAAKVVDRYRWDLSGAARDKAIQDVEKILQREEPRMKVRPIHRRVLPDGLKSA